MNGYGSFDQAVSEKKIFLEINQSETRIACGGHVLLTDRDEINKLYRGPFIDASDQVTVHLVKKFQRRRFFKFCQSEKKIAYMAATGNSCF
jgi:hypothetical protein